MKTTVKDFIEFETDCLRDMVNDPEWRKGWLEKRLEKKSVWTTQKSVMEYLNGVWGDLPRNTEARQLLDNKNELRKVAKEIIKEL